MSAVDDYEMEKLSRGITVKRADDAGTMIGLADTAITELEDEIKRITALWEQDKSTLMDVLPSADATDWALGQMQIALNRAAEAEKRMIATEEDWKKRQNESRELLAKKDAHVGDCHRRIEALEEEKQHYLHTCRYCCRELPWTDGTRVEYWCQHCGAEQPTTNTNVRWVEDIA